jgi:hypothetical protein
MQAAEIGGWVTIVKDVLLGLSAVSAAVFAYLGLDAWRKELKGKAEYELAKNVLKSAYRVRESFKHVRHPAIFQYEYPPDMTDHIGHLKPEHDYEGTAHVYETRWKKMDEAFRELEEHHLAAQVEWGAEFQDVIKKLRSCRADLLVTIQQFLERKKNPHGASRSTAEERAEERSVLYHLGSDSKHDKFTPEIDAAVDEFEKWLRPHIRSRG